MSALTAAALARRACWKLSADPARCRHLHRFRQECPQHADCSWKRCRRCGATISHARRCPAITKYGRQCLSAVRVDLGFRTCASHAADTCEVSA